jgi:DNA-binding transcriptional ArsR family regulator
MVQSSADADVDADDALDLVFAALSDRTRRNVLGTLTGSAEGLSVTELAQPHGMSLTGFMKHLRVLEDAGLLARTKEGRVVRCELAPAPLQEAAVWLSRYEKFWTERLDALGRYLESDSWQQHSKSRALASNATTPSRSKGSSGRGPTRKR